MNKIFIIRFFLKFVFLFVILLFSCNTNTFFKDAKLSVRNNADQKITNLYLCAAFVSNNTDVENSTPWEFGSIDSKSNRTFNIQGGKYKIAFKFEDGRIVKLTDFFDNWADVDFFNNKTNYITIYNNSWE